MALRDALKSRAGAAVFASGLYDLLHGSGTKREAVHDLGRSGIAATTSSDARTDVAARDGLRLPGGPGRSLLSQAHGDSPRRSGVWFRVRLPEHAELAYLPK